MSAIQGARPVDGPVATFVHNTNRTLTTTDGFKNVAELALAFFDTLSAAAIAIPAALSAVVTAIGSTVGILTIMSIFKRIKAFVTRDDQGRRLWERDSKAEAAMTVTAIAGVGLYNISSLARFFQSINAINIARALPVINIIGSAGLLTCVSIDIAGQIKDLKAVPAARRDALAKAVDYNNLEDMDKFAQKRITSLRARIDKKATALLNLSGEHDAKGAADAKLVYADSREAASINEDMRKLASRMTKWEMLAYTTDHQTKRQIFAQFKAAKIAKATDQISNCNTTVKRAWINIAFDVTVIALVVLAFVLPAVMPIALGVSIALLGVANSLLELTTFVFDHIIKEKVINHVKLPERIFMLPQPPRALAA